VTSPAKGARGKQKQKEPEEPPKPVITPMQKISKMLLFNKNGEEIDEMTSDIPLFRFVHPNKELIQRLIMKAASLKNTNEMKALLQW
jgi:hypothetical protein